MARKRKSSTTTTDGGASRTSSKPKDSSSKPKDSSSVLEWLFDDVDGASLAIFRMLWGLVMCYEVYTHYQGNLGKTKFLFMSSDFRVKYWMFEFLEPWSTVDQWKTYLSTLALISVFQAVGFFHRTSHFLFWIGFGYIYLLDMSYYLNHFYLVMIVQFMLIVVPASNCWSMDDMIFGKDGPSRSKVPRWSVLFFRILLAIVYTFAGVCKLNLDWLRGEPLRHWLAKRGFMPLIGPLLMDPFACYFFSWGGMIFDMTIGAMLLIPGKSIWLATGLCYFFHLTNKLIFNIGIFPWMCIAATSIFWSPSWPRYGFPDPLDVIPSGPPGSSQSDAKDTSASSSSSAGSKASKKQSKQSPSKQRLPTAISRAETVVKFKGPLRVWHYVVIAGLVAFMLVMILMPLRHHTYPGDVAWNEFGHKFSWRMKLRDKACEMRIRVRAHTTGGGEYAPHFRVGEGANMKQWRKLKSRPQSIVQYAHFLSERIKEREEDVEHVAVYVDSICSLNFRVAAPLINSSVDLVKEELWAEPYHWVLPIPQHTEEELDMLPWRWSWDGWLPILPPMNQQLPGPDELRRLRQGSKAF